MLRYQQEILRRTEKSKDKKILLLKPRCLGKKMIKYYRLNENNEVEECDMFQAEYFLRSGRKIIKQGFVGDKWISTVFLSIDHNYVDHNGSDPIVFETMIFPKRKSPLIEEHCQRYRTYQQALDGHNIIVEKLKQGMPLDD